MGYSLTKLGIINEDDLTKFLSKQYGVPPSTWRSSTSDREVIQLVPPGGRRAPSLIPVNRAGSSLIIAMADPSNIYAIDDLKFLTGYNIEVVVASEVGIDEAISSTTRTRSATTT